MMLAINALSPFSQAAPDCQHPRGGTAEIGEAGRRWGLIPTPRSHAHPNQETRTEKCKMLYFPVPGAQHSVDRSNLSKETYLGSHQLSESVCDAKFLRNYFDVRVAVK